MGLDPGEAEIRSGSLPILFKGPFTGILKGSFKGSIRDLWGLGFRIGVSMITKTIFGRGVPYYNCYKGSFEGPL